ncbi:hypothetical protein AAFC00_001065 [Neodothiora populina]|uniref:tyrosinase n=1 Tax=Neodothiora populina TaxID=2781224 RepID=A0ABR3PNQ2_9PEZI
MLWSNLFIVTVVGFLASFHLGLAEAATAVTGVQGNGVQLRMELRTMMRQYPDMFNVYLLGLRDFMSVDQSDPLSYYQIAGIHGRPYLPWDNVGTAPGDGGGYCTHVSNLFLPWHRPYLALVEIQQTLYTHILAAANAFPEGPTRTKYVTAAGNWRMPYWDWAMEPCSTCNAYPTVLTEQYVNLDTPTGMQWIENPLFRYDFDPISADDMVYDPFSEWTVTKRFPTNWTSSALSQNDKVAEQIANNQVSARDRLYNLFTSYSNFSQFGNEAWISSSTTNADSLESLHDVIHAITGNNGHMTYLDYSSFDPVFWLHHVMVDRCFAIWQVVYPNSYVEPMAAVGGTFTYTAGTINDVNSPLPPFHSDTNGTNWTPASVVNTTTFGYTYPELSNATQSTVKSAINSLYGNTAGSTTVSKTKLKSRLMNKRVVDNVDAAATVQGGASKDGSSYQYIANVVSQKFAMGSSYGVYMFLGDYTETSSDWGTDPNLVGIHGIFANLARHGTAGTIRPRDMTDLKGTGSIPLTTSLIHKVVTGELASLSSEDVAPYLEQHLSWRVAYFDGTEIPIESVLDLSVSVVQSHVQPATSHSAFPVWGPFVSLANVTASKPGGHKGRYWDSPEDGTSYGYDRGRADSGMSWGVTSTITSTIFLPLASCSLPCRGTNVSAADAHATSF